MKVMLLTIFVGGQGEMHRILVGEARSKITNVLMTNEMHSSYNQFLFHSFCLLYMFRTSLVRHQEHGIMYCITQYNRCNRAIRRV